MSSVRQYSCDACYRSKSKCDKGSPCSYCVRHGVVCMPSQVETSDRPRKRRFPEAELLDRIRKYEAALESYGADLDAIRNGRFTVEKSRRTRPRFDSPDSRSTDRQTDGKESEAADIDAFEEMQEVHKLLDDGGASRRWPTRIMSHFDRLYPTDGADMLFGHFHELEAQPTPHPDAFQIFELWRVYSENVLPLNKILHGPTMQRKISQYGSSIESAAPREQALFFAVYTMAVGSLDDQQCLDTFHQAKEDLLHRFQLNTQIWLRRAELWRTADLQVLQAFVLYLTNLQNVVDPRSHVAFTAVADRLARRMRLHRPLPPHLLPADQGLLDVEMGKRLWWELCLLERRALEKSSMGTADLPHQGKIDLPLMLSDADLDGLQDQTGAAGGPHTFGRDPHIKLSPEMIFFMVRCESVRFLNKVRERPGSQNGWTEFSTPLIPFSEKANLINDFERLLQERYLSQCNESIATHRFTVLCARGLVGRMRLSSLLSEEMRLDRLPAGEKALHPDAVRKVQQSLLEISTQTLEERAELYLVRAHGKFRWFLFHNMPFVALIHNVRLLRLFVDGPLVERAWRTVEKNISSFKGPRALLTGALRKAAANSAGFLVDELVLRAWSRRRVALGIGANDPVPPFIADVSARHQIPPTAMVPPRGASAEQAYGNGVPQMPFYSGSDVPQTTPATDADQLSSLASLLGAADQDFDWSRWLDDLSTPATMTDATIATPPVSEFGANFALVPS
ncbi:unnamed protein product [Parajaminaea phylloscopi]